MISLFFSGRNPIGALELAPDQGNVCILDREVGVGERFSEGLAMIQMYT